VGAVGCWLCRILHTRQQVAKCIECLATATIPFTCMSPPASALIPFTHAFPLSVPGSLLLPPTLCLCSWGDTLHSVLHHLVDHLTVTGRSEAHVTGAQYQALLDNTYLWIDIVTVPQVGRAWAG
jgi:hypothetical protein